MEDLISQSKNVAISVNIIMGNYVYPKSFRRLIEPI